MSRAKLPSYDAENLAWAKRILANPRLHEHPYDGAAQVARMIVERIEHGQAVPSKRKERHMSPAINKIQDVNGMF